MQRLFIFQALMKWPLAIFLLLEAGCAYRLGSGSGRLAGGYRQVSMPMFKNKSHEVGAEVFFTQALQQQFLKSKSATLVEEPRAEVRVEGDIENIIYRPESKRSADDSAKTLLPKGTVIAEQYRILVTVNAKIIRRSDNEILWQSQFKGERTYAAPQVTAPGVNTVNPLYNLSARRQNLSLMAEDMMLEAYSRMTENF